MRDFPIRLPRDRGDSDGPPHATSGWASEDEIMRYRYAPDDAGERDTLFLGAYPSKEGMAWAAQNTLALSALAERHKGDRREAERAEKHLRMEILRRSDAIGISDDRHVVTFAGSRAGKGRSLILPNLALYRGSVVCLDPKGENATLTARRRGAGGDGIEGLNQKVAVLDPFRVADVPDDMRGSINPLDYVSTIDDAAMVAEGLVLGSATHDTHWDENARMILRAIILHLKSKHAQPTLRTLRAFLTRGDVEGYAVDCAQKDQRRERGEEIYNHDNAFQYLLVAMQENPAFGGVIEASATVLLNMGPDERGSVISTAARHTLFLDSEAMELVLGHSTFSMDEVKSAPGGMSVYLCLPAHRMGSHGRWLRVMIAAFLERMYQTLTPPAAGAPVLFLLDEFATLGRLDVIEKAAGYAAGFGIKIWAILQDLPQLKAHYRDSWETFIGNAGVVQVFGVSDTETTAFAAKLLGEVETRRMGVSQSESVNDGRQAASTQSKLHGLAGRNAMETMWRAGAAALSDDQTRSTSRSRSQNMTEQFHVVPLMRPDEIARVFAREAGSMIVAIKGEYPMAILRVNRDEDQLLSALYPDTFLERSIVEAAHRSFMAEAFN